MKYAVFKTVCIESKFDKCNQKKRLYFTMFGCRGRFSFSLDAHPLKICSIPTSPLLAILSSRSLLPVIRYSIGILVIILVVHRLVSVGPCLVREIVILVWVLHVLRAVLWLLWIVRHSVRKILQSMLITMAAVST